MSAILYVSKPLSPPWNDSGKNLVRDLAEAAPRHAVRVFAGPGYEPGSRGVRIHRRLGASAYAPGFSQRASVFGAILRVPRDVRALHFFFAPNPVTSTVARAAMVLNRRPALQTISSSPASYSGIRRLCFGRTIVALSEYNRRKLAEAGVRRVVKIHPGLDLSRQGESAAGAERWREAIGAEGRRVVLYAGDYEFSTGARLVLEMVEPLRKTVPDMLVVFACRRKTAAAGPVEARIRSEAESRGLLPNIRFLNEVGDMPGLLTLADLSVMPVERLYAKMDMPLVLLEHMALGRPVVVSDSEPLREVLPGGAGGRVVPHGDVGRLADAVAEFLRDEGARRDAGASARHLVERHFDIRKSAAAYADLYDALA
ncbi:MAG: glycosyltransferase family 4 protein [Myxococcota bacterium]